MDWIRDARDWPLLLNILGTLGVGVVTWLRKPGGEAMSAVRALEKALADSNSEHRNRLTAIDAQLKHMPTSEELSDLEGDVKAINERTKWQSDEIETIRATLARIETYLLSIK